MRLLIGMYLLFGVFQTVIAVVSLVGVQAVLTWLGVIPRRNQPGRDEPPEVALIMSLIAVVFLTMAYGLWKRWRLVRLGILVSFWWTVAVSAFVCGAVIASRLGLIDRSTLGINEPLWETIATAAGASAFWGWQYYVLTRPSVRESFK